MYPDESPTVPLPIGRQARRRSRFPAGRIAVAAALAVVLLAGVGVLAWPVLFGPAAASTASAAGEVFLEPAGTPGRDPFTGNIVVGNPPGTKSQTPVGTGGTAVPTVAGDTPALYGGSRNEHVCDRQKLITFLEQNRDKATAWASVLGIQPVDIASFIGTLTPLQLRADTRVTNHGFANGKATTLQSVLQAGTAVLVDDMGRPRVKCGCGNPLLDPVATPIAPRYTGSPWPDFSPRSVSAVSSATTRVARFVVYDLRTGETFYRPTGSDGQADTPTTPPPVVTTTPTPPPPPPSPTALSCPRGTHIRGSTCVSDAPAACPAGQVRVSGRCTVPPLTCAAGSHVSDDHSTCVPDAPTCRDGTHLGDDGVTCVDDIPDCKAGTHRADDGTCVDDTPTCPRGTHLSGSTCVDDKPTCPDGTHLVGSTCVKDQPTECPDGTHLSEGKCVDNPPKSCPDGTHPVSDGTSCAKDAPKLCPDGSKPDANGSCAAPHDPTCPGGANPDGSCRSTGGRRPGAGRRRRRLPDPRPADDR